MKKIRRRGPPRGSAKQVALPKFRQEHWARWLELADDQEPWSSSFELWQREAEERAARLRDAGLTVVWVELQPESFMAWCQLRGYRNDSEARNRFAAESVGNIPPPNLTEPGG